jgi:hypothetical protein
MVGEAVVDLEYLLLPLPPRVDGAAHRSGHHAH